MRGKSDRSNQGELFRPMLVEFIDMNHELRPLTQWQKKYNKAISKTRWVVERTFGSLKRWFGSGTTRLKGTDKVHSVHVLEAIAHNLKRSPGWCVSSPNNRGIQGKICPQKQKITLNSFQNLNLNYSKIS